MAAVRWNLYSVSLRLWCCVILTHVPSAVHSQLTIQGCTASNIYIANTTVSPSLTCLGLDDTVTVVWNIKRYSDATISVVGYCYPGSCGFYQFSDHFTLSRSNGSSTLTFRDLQFSDRATIYCDQVKTNTSCKVNVIEEYKLKECKDGVLEVEENGEGTILCSGMTQTQSMYWAVSSKNGTVQTIRPTTFNPPTTTNSLTVIRNGTTSTLTVRDQKADLNGTNVVCSKLDNATMATCLIRVVPPKGVTETVTDAVTERGYTETDDTEASLAFSSHVEVIAGTVAGAWILLIVIIAVVVTVVIKRRQRDTADTANVAYISADQFDAHRTATAASSGAATPAAMDEDPYNRLFDRPNPIQN